MAPAGVAKFQESTVKMIKNNSSHVERAEEESTLAPETKSKSTKSSKPKSRGIRPAEPQGVVNPEDDPELEEAFEVALAQPPEEPEDEIEPFDPENLKIDQSKLDVGISSKPIYTTLAVRKPKKAEWFRVHPSDEFKTRIAFFEDEEEREIYAIVPAVSEQLEPYDYKTATMYLCINRQGVPFLWPVKQSGVDGKPMRWFDSANDAVKEARKHWIRIRADADSYVMYTTTIEIPEPTWPEGTMRDMLKLAFRERIVKDMEHPIILQLRGMA
jgi:hypothetical protein